MLRHTKLLAVVTLLILLTAPAHSQELRLWADEDRTRCEVIISEPYTAFDVFVFLEPGVYGAFAVEYKLSVPPGHFSPAQTPNPVVSAATIGAWCGSPGISAPFTSCQTERFWVCKMAMMSPDIEPGIYFLHPKEDTQFIGVAICPDPRPMVDAWVYGCFGYNDSCIYCGFNSNEETSWGAVKSIYR